MIDPSTLTEEPQVVMMLNGGGDIMFAFANVHGWKAYHTPGVFFPHPNRWTEVSPEIVEIVEFAPKWRQVEFEDIKPGWLVEIRRGTFARRDIVTRVSQEAFYREWNYRETIFAWLPTEERDGFSFWTTEPEPTLPLDVEDALEVISSYLGKEVAEQVREILEKNL